MRERDVARIALVKRELLGMPRRLGVELEGLTVKQIEALLTKRFRELLERFSRM